MTSQGPSVQGGRPQGRPLFASGLGRALVGRPVAFALLAGGLCAPPLAAQPSLSPAPPIFQPPNAQIAPTAPGGGPPGGSRVVYRCPTPGAVMYTDALSPSEAALLGCLRLDPAPVTVIQPQPPRPQADRAPPSATAGAATPRASVPAPSPSGARVPTAVQRERDAQSRRILQDELAREAAALQALEREYAGGQPERRGDERNYARYQERVEALRAAIARKQADIAALRREIARLDR